MRQVALVTGASRGIGSAIARQPRRWQNACKVRDALS